MTDETTQETLMILSVILKTSQLITVILHIGNLQLLQKFVFYNCTSPIPQSYMLPPEQPNKMLFFTPVEIITITNYLILLKCSPLHSSQNLCISPELWTQYFQKLPLGKSMNWGKYDTFKPTLKDNISHFQHAAVAQVAQLLKVQEILIQPI